MSPAGRRGPISTSRLIRDPTVRERSRPGYVLPQILRKNVPGCFRDPAPGTRQGENSLGWSGPEKAPESLQMLAFPLMPP
jgi:hypothetical protein